MKLQKLQSDLFDFAAGDRPATTFDLIRDMCKDSQVHEFAYGVIYTYKDIPRLIKRGAIHVEDGALILKENTAKQYYYFFVSPTPARLLEARRQGFRCKLLDKVDDIDTFTPRNEIVYDLKKVFDPMSYPNAKKRKQRIKYPFVFLDRENIRIEPLRYTELPEAIHLHDKWLAAKFADPNVYRINFPSGRYRRCTQYAFDDRSVFKIYKARDYNSGKLVAVRVIAYDGPKAFDLAYYSDYPNMKSQMTEYLNVAFMKEMLDAGITSLNAGLITYKSLTQFKDHFPNTTLTWYQWK